MTFEIPAHPVARAYERSGMPTRNKGWSDAEAALLRRILADHEAELAKVTLERDSYMLMSKMRPAPMADMVPAEELAKVKAERDAAVADANQLAADIHYPGCWDTAAYPTLKDALHELVTSAPCTTCAARKEEGK